MRDLLPALEDLHMAELQRLTADHAPALLTFELTNRAYFAASVPDRGDEYFAKFAVRHAALLAEQETGLCHFHVLVEDGVIVGRVNLVDAIDGTAELGYRIAKHTSGKGLATSAVAEICALAVADYSLRTLHAKTTLDNVASQAVLTRNGFVCTGETALDGRPGLSYAKVLMAQ